MNGKAKRWHKWRSQPEACLLAVLFTAGLTLFWSGLSIRSLWGPEGRWAVIVKEMIQSGNYFLPTINGVVYFDKPLMSYWAIIPFVKLGGLTEAMLRMPATIAGIGTVICIFSIGRRLFDATAGFLAAALLLTSPMFLLWGRTASAELLNTFAIWIMFSAFLAARSDNRFRYHLLFYGTGAIGSFLKGPVAPSVVLSGILAYEACEVFNEFRTSGFNHYAAKAAIRKHFSWLISGPGLAGLFLGLCLFCFLLFLPVLLTGSWTSVLLMWKENVVRFVSPFDHHDPPYSYFVHIPLFCAPWTFFALASIWRTRHWEAGSARRWTLGSALGMFLFFLVSGSRRAYYILPLIPALSLIAGKAIKDWVREETCFNSRLMDGAGLCTAVLLILSAFVFFYIYLFIPTYRHGSQILVGFLTAAGAIFSGNLLLKKDRLKALASFLLLFFLISLWGLTKGMSIAEEQRGLKDFAYQASKEIDKVGQHNVVLYGGADSDIIFYLNRPSAISHAKSFAELQTFREKHPKGLLVAHINEISGGKKAYFQELIPIIKQKGSDNRHEERFALMKFPASL